MRRPRESLRGLPDIHSMGADSIPGDETLGATPATGDKREIEPIHCFALRLRGDFSTRLFMALILASASPIRSAMLSAAGVAHRVEPAAIDEAALKDGAIAPADLAQHLADAKALAVSAVNPGEWALGGDSLVRVGGERFDKPRDREQAADHLRAFSGRTMELTSAATLARGASVDWQGSQTARLHVRPLSDAFIAAYLDAEWPAVAYCAGAFRLEARGVQLFETIEGDHFTVLGMPLLPLLGVLRARGLLPA